MKKRVIVTNIAVLQPAELRLREEPRCYFLNNQGRNCRPGENSSTVASSTWDPSRARHTVRNQSLSSEIFISRNFVGVAEKY